MLAYSVGSGEYFQFDGVGGVTYVKHVNQSLITAGGSVGPWCPHDGESPTNGDDLPEPVVLSGVGGGELGDFLELAFRTCWPCGIREKNE